MLQISKWRNTELCNLLRPRQPTYAEIIVKHSFIASHSLRQLPINFQSLHKRSRLKVTHIKKVYSCTCLFIHVCKHQKLVIVVSNNSSMLTMIPIKDGRHAYSNPIFPTHPTEKKNFNSNMKRTRELHIYDSQLQDDTTK